MLTRSAKAKGASLQRWTRDKIIAQFPHLDTEDVKSTVMGENGLDIQLSKLARKFLPIGIECKNHAKFAVYAHYEQATRNAFLVTSNVEPVLIIKGNHKKPLAVVDAAYFFSLMRARYDASLINIDDPDKA